MHTFSWLSILWSLISRTVLIAYCPCSKALSIFLMATYRSPSSAEPSVSPTDEITAALSLQATTTPKVPYPATTPKDHHQSIKCALVRAGGRRDCPFQPLRVCLSTDINGLVARLHVEVDVVDTPFGEIFLAFVSLVLRPALDVLSLRVVAAAAAAAFHHDLCR